MHLSKKNVVVFLKGGLGNQLFQYATAKSLALRLGVGLTLDLSWFIDNKSQHTQYILDRFKIDEQIFLPSQYIPRKVRIFLYKTIKFLSLFGFTLPHIEEVDFKYTNKLLDINNPVILDGYWQNEIYFSKYRDEIKPLIKLNSKINSKDYQLIERIKGSNSICLHIRRGDYISNTNASRIHGICSKEYYLKAIQVVSNSIQAPLFFIFSDEPHWVRSNFNFDCQSIYIDSNLLNPEIDFTLMSYCKHFIIANSTFSWWAAWLSESKNKKIIAPKQWFLNKELNDSFSLDQKWIRI
tara:strand:- start:2477 stop:3361 length:885 start_codon:yes stop_codon:yes gene_type:complete